MSESNQKQLGNALWKIAERPIAVDDLILAYSRKVGALTTYGIGLSQQLFPSPTE